MAVEGRVGYPFKLKLGTISQANHWIANNQILAYEPYVREMRIWADLFSEVEVFTPLTTMPQLGSLCAYERGNVRFRFVRYNTRIFSLGFLVRMFQFPVVFFQMAGFIRRHDLLLIRAPGHFSLMAHILAVLLRKKSVTKFAGFFGAYEGERLPSVVERFFMRNFLTSRNLVLVYGRQSKPNFVSFFPLVMSESEMNWMDSLDGMAPDDTIFRFVSLGRLLNVKGYDLAIKGLGELYRTCPEWLWNYYLVGDGPEETLLRQLATDLGIADRVIFVGRKNYREAIILLKKANVLIMPGVKEGWPKSVAEAWITGVVPLCARAGLLPELINHGQNGFLFDPNPESLAAQCCAVRDLTDEQRKSMVAANKARVRQLSAESFKQHVAALCRELMNTSG